MHCQQPFTTDLIASNRREFKYLWYWDKHQITGFLNAKKQSLRRVEEVAVFYRKQPTYNPQMRKGKPQKKATGKGSNCYGEFTFRPHVCEDYYPTTLLSIAQPRYKGGHPTQKPVALLEYLIKTYTQDGDTVLDNCMGSGSSGVACVNTGRRFIGIEKDPEWFKVAEERIKECQKIMKP